MTRALHVNGIIRDPDYDNEVLLILSRCPTEDEMLLLQAGARDALGDAPGADPAAGKPA